MIPLRKVLLKEKSTLHVKLFKVTPSHFIQLKVKNQKENIFMDTSILVPATNATSLLEEVITLNFGLVVYKKILQFTTCIFFL